MGRMENFSEHDLDLSMMKESVRQRMVVESKMSMVNLTTILGKIVHS